MVTSGQSVDIIFPQQPSKVVPQVSGRINILPSFARQMATPITLVIKGSLQGTLDLQRMKVEIPLNLTLSLKPGEDRVLARRNFRSPLSAPPGSLSVSGWEIRVVLQVGEPLPPSPLKIEKLPPSPPSQ